MTAKVYQLHMLNERPKVRRQCQVPGICPFISCRYHLYTDQGGHAKPRSRANKVLDKLANELPEYFEEIYLEEFVSILEAMPHTCALDAADEEARSQEKVGELLNTSKQYVSITEESARESFAEELAKERARHSRQGKEKAKRDKAV